MSRVGRKLKAIVITGSLSVLLTLSIYSGTPTRKSDNQYTGNNRSAATLIPYHIVWYQIGPYQKDIDMVFKEVNIYTKQKINATVEMKVIDWQNYDKRVKACIASGELFDICFTTAYINHYAQNATNGAFVALDPLLEKYGQGILKYIQPLFFEGIRIKGKIYAVPANKEIAHQNALVFNKKYVDKYGLNLTKIKTLYELEPMLKLLKEKEPDIVPYAIQAAFNNSLSLPFNRIIDNVPGSLYYDNRTGYKIINELDTPEYKKYFSTIYGWYQSGYMQKEVFALKQLDELEKKGNWFVSAISNSPYANITYNLKLGYETEVIPLQTPVIENRDCGGSMLAISSTSQNPERAMMFLELLNTDKYLYNLVTFGIEDIHYIMKSENVYEYPAAKYKYTPTYGLAPFTVGNIMLSNINSHYPPTIWDDYRKFNDSAVKSPLLGFSFNPTAVKQELSDLVSISSEFEGPLKTGAVNPDIYVPKALAKYKAAGLDKVIEEEQRQLNTWVAAAKTQN
jgi:putative aldouronate transport system substrate-binding protein